MRRPHTVVSQWAEPILRKGVRAFSKAKSGATAVEFAIIAAPLVALLFAVFETGVVLFAQEYLQTATTQTARLIMTGQAQSQGLTASQFQSDVCANATAMFTCSGIYVNVQEFSTFSSISPTSPVSNGTFNPAKMNYTVGGPGDIELVQVYYQWPTILAPLGFNLSNINGNYYLMVATAVIKNEPY